MLWKVENLTVLAVLILLSIQDIKKRRISVMVLLASFFGICIYLIGWQMADWRTHVLGLAAGSVFFGVSRITQEGIGYGDSSVISLVGFFAGFWNLLELMVISWTLLAVAALFCLLFKTRSRKASLPCVPFLTAGYLILLVL